jgi:hypothetical protein
MDVPWLSTGPFLWNMQSIEEAPDEEGVYAIVSITERLYVGSGKIKHQLIGHWNKQNGADRCIWSKRPVRIFWEVCSDAAERRAEVLQNYPTLCNSTLR